MLEFQTSRFDIRLDFPPRKSGGMMFAATDLAILSQPISTNNTAWEALGDFRSHLVWRKQKAGEKDRAHRWVLPLACVAIALSTTSYGSGGHTLASGGQA